MKALIFIVLAIFSIKASADPLYEMSCYKRGVNTWKVFELFIGTSFHGSVTFGLCTSQEGDWLSVTKNTREYLREPETEFGKRTTVETEVREHIKLTESETKKIIKLYNQALNYNTFDEISGEDGSSWCMDTRRGANSLKACFWSPGHATKKRGLVGLHELGKHLWVFSKMGNDKRFKLY